MDGTLRPISFFWNDDLGRSPAVPFGCIFWIMMFYNLKKFTSRSLIWVIKLQSNLVIRNCLIMNKLVLRNHFLWPVCHLLHKNKEHLALRNNFRVTELFLIAKFDFILNPYKLKHGQFYKGWLSWCKIINVMRYNLSCNSQNRVFRSYLKTSLATPSKVEEGVGWWVNSADVVRKT